MPGQTRPHGILNTENDMASPRIKFNQQSEIGRKIARGLTMLRESRDVIRDARNALIQACDGADTGTAANFDAVVADVGYQQGDYASAEAAAKKSFDEIDSLHAKLNALGGQGDETGAAITQCNAIHGL